MAKWSDFTRGGVGRVALGALMPWLETTGISSGVSYYEAQKEKKARKAAEARAGARGKEIKAAGAEEDKVREATLGLLKAREARAGTEGEEMIADLKAQMGKASAQSFGRQAGRATGGGMLSSLSQIEMDLERQGRGIRREASDRATDAALDTQAFRRATMKDQRFLREETGELKESAKGLLAGAKTAGYIDESRLKDDVDRYIRDNGLSGSQADALRNEVDALVESDSWLPFV